MTRHRFRWTAEDIVIAIVIAVTVLVCAGAAVTFLVEERATRVRNEPLERVVPTVQP